MEFIQDSVEFDPYIALLHDNYTQFQDINTSVDVIPIFTLEINETMNILISSDINRLLSTADEDTHKWEVKSIKIHYIVNSISYIYMISIYPTAYNCDSIGTGKSVSTPCSHIPGCIYCIQYGDMRVLRGSEEGGLGSGLGLDAGTGIDIGIGVGIESSNKKLNENRGKYFELYKKKTFDATSSNYDDRNRHLFAAIVPPPAGSTRYDGGGQCTDGWLTDDCPMTQFTSGGNSVMHSEYKYIYKSYSYSIVTRNTLLLIICSIFIQYV